MSLLNKILQFKAKKMQFFTTPSHGQGNFSLPWLKDLYNLDFSEMDGLDNLRNPQGVLKEMLDKLTKIYDTKKTFALINGSSSGNIASILTILNQNDKILVAKNCHVSAKNGIHLAKCGTVFQDVIYDEKFGCPCNLDKQSIFKNLDTNEFKALHITSPTYEGVNFDIKEIIDYAHLKNVIVIVDEAHGALFPFSSKFPKSAIYLGADLVVQSLHKTAGGVNPSALLHVGKNSKVNPDEVQKSLNLINTTSPSYPLLASIEAVVDYLNENRNIVDDLAKNIADFKKYFENRIDFLNSYQIVMRVKNVDMIEFTDKLYDKYGIESEIAQSNYALFYCGLGTDIDKLNYLKKAIDEMLKG